MMMYKDNGLCKQNPAMKYLYNTDIGYTNK